MGTFGRHLLERGAVSPEQMEEATQVMVVFGGRLGTALVESGALTLEEVERHLSEHLDIPPAPRERLERPALDALEAIPADLVRRHQVFPMWLEKRTLHVAMSQPQDANRIDELAFVSSLTIKPYVVAERRLVQMLEHYYGIRPDSRFTDPHLLEMAGHVRPKRRSRLPGKTPVERQNRHSRDDEDETLRHRSALGIVPLDEGEELSPREESEAPQADRGDMNVEPTRTEHEQRSAAACQGPSPAGSPAQVAELESELVLLATPEAIPTLVLRIGAFYAQAVAFFAVRRGVIHGLLAAGNMAGNRVEDIHLPASSQSLLSAPASSETTFRGRPLFEGIDAELFRLLGRRPRELAIFPILLRGRTVSLLYADNGDDALAGSTIAAMEALCETTSAAYERLLLVSQNYI